MGIQTSDQGLLRDTITVLEGLGTRLSDTIAENFNGFLAPSLAQGDTAPRQATHAEVAEFRAACERELVVTNRSLDVALSCTTLLDCLCVAILFGQLANDGQLGAANSFVHEMEFLASCQPRVSSPSMFSRGNLEAALRALVLARQHGVLDGHLTLTDGWTDGEITQAALGERWQVHDQLAWSRRSEHGAFPTHYDWEYSLRLAQRIRERGGDHPDLRVLLMIHTFVLTSWVDLLREVHGEFTDPALRTLLRERTLLHLPADLTLSVSMADDLASAAATLLLPWQMLADTMPEPVRREAERWRALLTVDPAALGRNTARRHVFDSPLITTPLVEVEDMVLFSLPHLFSTDLSQLVARVFARLPNQSYHRARGEAVEEAALHHLAGVFTGARMMRGGKYPGVRPGELIEVDGVLVWEDVVLVLEGKGGYLSTRSRRGDPEAAVSELQRRVGDGYFQVARLVRALERDGHVTLTGHRGETLTLDRRSVRRVYAVVPTADSFAAVSTLLGLLWRQDVLPDRALPVILAVQELNLLTDLLPTPPELLAYLEYREEVLATPQLRTGGELELLAAFAATIDVVGAFRELEVSSAALSTDHQEKYLDPWLQDSFHSWLNDLPPVPPPRRHGEEHRAKIDRLLSVTHNTAAAVVLHQLTGAQLHAAELYAGNVPRLRRGTLSPISVDGLGIVVAHPLDPIDTLRGVPQVRKLRACCRWIMYLTPGVDGAEFRHAERGDAHVLGSGTGDSLTENSRLGAVADWFDRAAARRHGAHRPVTTADQENIDALIQAGAPGTMALGLTRLGLTTAVLDLLDHAPELGLTQAADFYLTHVRHAADTLEVATTDLALTTTAAHDVLRLLIDRRIHPEHAATLIEHSARDPTTPPASLARTAGLLTDQDDTLLTEAVHTALDTLGMTPAQVGLTRGKKRSQTRDRLIGILRREHPALNPRAAVEHIERLWPPTE